VFHSKITYILSYKLIYFVFLPLYMLELKEVTNDTKQQFDDLVKTYHSYKPTTRIFGRRLNFLILLDGEIKGVIGFQSPVLPFPKPLDAYIGWHSKQQPSDYKDKNINMIVNNWRFTLMPDAPKNLGSRVLSESTKILSEQWQIKYNNEIELVFTYVGEGHKGTVYKAANWDYVGETQGWVYEGREGKHNYIRKYKDPTKKKLIFCYPLVRNWRKVLGVYRDL
jgi:hypothetical protein